MELPVNFLAGLVLGAIAGFALGFLTGAISKPEEKKVTKKDTKAKRLFTAANQEKDKKKKMELLGRILDKYPHSEWADKALEEVMKIRKEEPGD